MRFYLTQQPAARTPTAPEVQALQRFVRRLATLIEMRAMERNWEAAGELSPAVRDSIAAHIAFLRTEISRTQEQITQHTRQHMVLQLLAPLRMSNPGIGAATAVLMLAEINFPAFQHVPPVAAFAGVVPRLRQSRSWLSKLGSARLRRARYFPAVTVLRCNPAIQAWAAGLRLRGKCEMQISGAVLRKLLLLAFGVVTSGPRYDPTMVQRRESDPGTARA